MDKAKRYILLECIDREIHAPVFFDSFEVAYDEMVSRIADVLHVTTEELLKELEKEAKDSLDCYDFNINHSNAWITDYHNLNYDWEIFDVFIGDDDITCEWHGE